MGADDPFLMGPSYVPATGIRRFLSGTPAVVGMLALEDMVDLVAEAGLGAVRAKSVGLTEHAVEVSDRAARAARGRARLAAATPTGAAGTSRSTTR